MTEEVTGPAPDSIVNREAAENAAAVATKDKSDRREIKGGLPYSQSPGVFKKTLEQIIQAERPDNFSSNFMATILKLTGGSAKAVPPLLKKMQFINPDGSPSQLYSKFKTDGGRSQAAFEGLGVLFLNYSRGMNTFTKLMKLRLRI